MESNNAYEKKTFKTFIILMITVLLSPFLFNALLIPLLGEDIVFKLIFIYMAGVIILISYIVFKKERVYWISSYSYSDACNMTSEERAKIGLRLFKVVRACFGILIGYFTVGIFINTHFALDMVVFCGISIIACIKT